MSLSSCTLYESEGKRFLDSRAVDILANSNGVTATVSVRYAGSCSEIQLQANLKTDVGLLATTDDIGIDSHACDLIYTDLSCFFLESTDSGVHSYACQFHSLEAERRFIELFPDAVLQ